MLPGWTYWTYSEYVETVHRKGSKANGSPLLLRTAIGD